MTNDETQKRVFENQGGYVSKIQFNSGISVDIKQDDIVVFVGPNNAGKSQSLKDIYELSQSEQSATVVKQIELQKSSGDIEEYIKSISTMNTQSGSDFYSGWDYNIYSGDIAWWTNQKCYGDTRQIFVAYLNTLGRLTISDPAPNITRNAVKQHPIHYAAFDKKYRKWLSDSFKKAFDKDLIPNTQFGSKIPLCIGSSVKLHEEYSDEQSRQEAYAEILDTYEQVQNQGDGIKSFTGILLYLMLDYYRTFLIDEPESFLHPPQANIMGQIVGQTLSNQQQAFISTHSEEIIKGLLAVCPTRIKIIRITRNENVNSFSVLDNNRFSEVWNDPLLKYSNIMSSLFHKSVVLCESDSDCKLYSIIESHIKHASGKYAETLFIHCGGKHRMEKISTALHTLDVDVKLVPDIDVLNDITVFKGIAESFGIVWSDISTDYNIVVSNLHSQKEEINRNDAKTTINRILDASNKLTLSKSEIREIGETIRIISKWANLKENGISAIPRGDATTAFARLNATLKDHQIYVVPVGELECFVKEVGGHGPEWVNMLLIKYPDLDSEVYDAVKSFVRSLNL